MKNNALPRLDASPQVRNKLLPYCRLKPGDIWVDSVCGHRVGCLDAARRDDIEGIMRVFTLMLNTQTFRRFFVDTIRK